MLTSLSSVLDDALIFGFVYLGPKYIENQFGTSASTAGIVIGMYFKVLLRLLSNVYDSYYLLKCQI